MTDRLELPKDRHIAQSVIEAEKHAREMGKIGEFFGSRENAAVYLAALIIFVAVITGAILAYTDPNLRADAMKALFALAATALGFMLGKQAK